ncbi:MAG: glycoside hydrolase family 127 protein [Verrucomicrobia bacterium]|nr:glycoside hydrolase family 127 protein [Verrucomicrobiota bacterium]
MQTMDLGLRRAGPCMWAGDPAGASCPAVQGGRSSPPTTPPHVGAYRGDAVSWRRGFGFAGRAAGVFAFVWTAVLLVSAALPVTRIDPAEQGFVSKRLEPAAPEAVPGPVRLAITRVIPEAARRLPLSAVRLTGGPLKNAQDLNARILLALEPDRMLAGYRLRAGLTPKAEGYGGWDAVQGKQLTGHLAGHYLSGVSLMYAATGDPRFRERVDHLVRELKEVQDHRGNGYLGALTDNQGTDAAELFEQVAGGDIRSGGFDLNGMWSPWYTLHKTYAGLRDAWRYTGNATALELERKFAAWAESIVGRMTDTQVQRMLNTEFGGMNEIFADLYADTGDLRWLQLSYRFEHHAFTEPLKRHQDNLAGKHGNTQVPKLIGSLARFSYVGDPGDGYAASFFWDRVVQHHSYATGGHGKDEYFGEPDQLSERVDGRVAETCNVYNMLKLTRQMFTLRPDAHYADFHERALFNHILASQDPQEGWACYMVPVGRGVQREYERNMLDGGFTCCTGSSLESHALHGHGLYYASDDTFWVNLYAPSTAAWAEADVRLTTETDFPEGESVRLQFKLAAPKRFTLALRRPFWTDAGFAVTVNGVPVPAVELAAPEADANRPRNRAAAEPTVSWFVRLERMWENGDVVSVTLPKRLRLEPLPDNPRRVALLWGPLVLAGTWARRRRPDAAGAGRRRSTRSPSSWPPSDRFQNGSSPFPTGRGAFGRWAWAMIARSSSSRCIGSIVGPTPCIGISSRHRNGSSVPRRSPPRASVRRSSRRPRWASCNPARCRRSATPTCRAKRLRRTASWVGPVGGRGSGSRSMCRWIRHIRWPSWSRTTWTSGANGPSTSWSTASGWVSSASNAAARCGSLTSSIRSRRSWSGTSSG